MKIFKPGIVTFDDMTQEQYIFYIKTIEEHLRHMIDKINKKEYRESPESYLGTIADSLSGIIARGSYFEGNSIWEYLDLIEAKYGKQNRDNWVNSHNYLLKTLIDVRWPGTELKFAEDIIAEAKEKKEKLNNNEQEKA